MKCSKLLCNQEVMPKIDKENQSICYMYSGVVSPLVPSPHWGFATYHEAKPLCFYHEEKAAGRFDTGYSK